MSEPEPVCSGDGSWRTSTWFGAATIAGGRAPTEPSQRPQGEETMRLMRAQILILLFNLQESESTLKEQVRLLEKAKRLSDRQAAKGR